MKLGGVKVLPCGDRNWATHNGSGRNPGIQSESDPEGGNRHPKRRATACCKVDRSNVLIGMQKRGVFWKISLYADGGDTFLVS
jgi:hypothetical protein